METVIQCLFRSLLLNKVFTIMHLIVFITIFKEMYASLSLILPSVNVHCFAKVQDWDVWAWSLWVLPQMWVTQTGLIRSVKCPKFKDMLFLHSWEHVHVRLHWFNCFQMCALASQPFHFCLFPPLSLLSPSGFYLAPSSHLHPLIHILCVIIFFYFGGGWTPSVTWAEIVVFVRMSLSHGLIQTLQATMACQGCLQSLFR